MAHILQVGAGSGGAVVLDLIARDPRVTRITLIEPDVYSSHNVHRHIFPASAVGRLKADLAAEWVRERRPDIEMETLAADLTDPAWQARFAERVSVCDVGVCAVDNEPAKYAFDALLRAAGKPWTLGEVLSGGIGGWVHRFSPGGPCYACIAGYLQRAVAEEDPGPPPDYADPRGALETTIPASKASIAAIAALHAVVTLDLLEPAAAHDFTSLLFTLKRVPGIFEAPFRSLRYQIPRRPDCLICSTAARAPAGENLDVAVDEALGRLAAR